MHRERPQQGDRQGAITQEQVRLAMRQLPTMQAASFLVALVLAYLVRGMVPAANIVLWLALVLAVVVCRIVLYRRFTRLGDGPFDGPGWRSAFQLLSLLSGTVWGLSALLLFPAGNPALISLFILVMASLAASTTVSHASLRLSPLAWAGPALLLYAVRCFGAGTVYGTAAGFLILLYLVTVIVYSFKHHRSVTLSIALRFENLDLLEELRRANDRLKEDIAKREQAERERDSLIADLRRAAAEIRNLHGILPICASCKKIRDERDTWKPLETYFSEHSATQFSHGLCPDCGARALDAARGAKKSS